MLNPEQSAKIDAILSSADEDQEDLVDKESMQDVWFTKYSAMPYKDLALKMLELREASKKAENAKTMLDAEHDIIRLRVVPQRLSEDGLSSMNIPGVGRLGLTKDAYCTQVKENQAEFFQWLRDNDYGDLIKDTVNPSSLKSLVKELDAAAQENPQEFSMDDGDAADKSAFEEVTEKYVKYTPFMRASVTKGK